MRSLIRSGNKSFNRRIYLFPLSAGLKKCFIIKYGELGSVKVALRAERKYEMKRCVVAVIVSIVLLSISVAHAGDQEVAVKRMLKRLAGRWTWTGQQANIGADNSPYGQAGKFVGSGEGRLIMNDQFILEKYQEKSPEGNMLYGTSLISYDPVKKCYISHDCMSDGSTSIAEFTIKKRIRKDKITITSKSGEILLARVEGEYSRDWKRYEATWEGSTDNGKTWQEWATLVNEKTVEATSDEQEIKKIYERAFEALLKADIAFFDRHLTDEALFRNDDGAIVRKAQFLRNLELGDYKVDSCKIEALNVQVYGDAAIGDLHWSENSRYKTIDLSGQYLSTDTWIKRDGRWQWLASQAAKVKNAVTDTPKPSPELKKLEGIVGKWEYEGEQASPPMAGLPYGGAGKYFGTFTWRYVLGGFFLERKFEDNNPSGKTDILNLIGYDANAGKYTDYWFTSDGSTEVATATLDGRTWTSNATMISGEGKEVLMQTVLKYSPDWDSASATVEVSADGGKTWKLWFKDEAKKVNQ